KPAPASRSVTRWSNCPQARWWDRSPAGRRSAAPPPSPAARPPRRAPARTRPTVAGVSRSFLPSAPVSPPGFVVDRLDPHPWQSGGAGRELSQARGAAIAAKSSLVTHGDVGVLVACGRILQAVRVVGVLCFLLILRDQIVLAGRLLGVDVAAAVEA